MTDTYYAKALERIGRYSLCKVKDKRARLHTKDCTRWIAQGVMLCTALDDLEIGDWGYFEPVVWNNRPYGDGIRIDTRKPEPIVEEKLRHKPS